MSLTDKEWKHVGAEKNDNEIKRFAFQSINQ